MLFFLSQFFSFFFSSIFLRVLNDCVIQVQVLVALPIWKAIQRYEAVLVVALLVLFFFFTSFSLLIAYFISFESEERLCFRDVVPDIKLWVLKDRVGCIKQNIV